MQTFNELKRGDTIRITFGAKASQVAVVHDWTRSGNCRVWKFSAKRRVWKGPLRLHEGEFIGAINGAPDAPLPAEYARLGRGYPRNPLRAS